MVHFRVMSVLGKSSRVEALLLKRQLSKGFRLRLKQQGVTVASLARETGTSRTAIRRVLDGKNTFITLYTSVRTAKGLGYKVAIVMEPTIDVVERVDAPIEVEPLIDALGEALDRLPANAARADASPAVR
jgi:transcriptional regulator with XRE-family HTH domain